MRHLNLLPFGLLFSTLASGQAPYQNISHFFWAARTAFAGQSNWYEFEPVTAVPVICNAAQSRCLATGYQFQGGENARFYSLWKPPTGLYTVWGGSEAIYGICDVQGTTFTLRQNNCSGSVVKFTDNGIGQQNVLINRYYTYFTQVSGFPAGTVLNWYWMWPGGIYSPASTSNGIPYAYAAANYALQAIIPSTAAPGFYKVSITAAQDTLGNNASTVDWVITVHAPPQFKPTKPTYIPAIPGLSGWQTTMTSSSGGALEWCKDPANPTEVFGFGDFSEVWFYDGARVYFQMADYAAQNGLPDPGWNNCGHNIASQYADFIISTKGAMWGYIVFPHGLAMASLLYPTETKFQQAFNLMLSNSPDTGLGGRIDDDLIRETSYALEVYTVAESMLGYPRNPNLQRTAEYIMSMLLSYTDGTSRYSSNQTFFDGLAMEALIDYYQLTQDARVPFIVKRMLDNIWANYDKIDHVIVYNPDPVGPHCSNTAIWWGTAGGDCAMHTIPAQVLHNLISGAFAWYWSVSGDDTYRSEGDELFQWALNSGIYSGKEFSQVYRWSFYYVNTRTTGQGARIR